MKLATAGRSAARTLTSIRARGLGACLPFPQVEKRHRPGDRHRGGSTETLNRGRRVNDTQPHTSERAL